LQARAEVLECNALHTLGQDETAVGVCETALRVFSETGNHAEIAQTLRFLGDIRQRQGRLDESTELHRKALKISQDSRDDRGCAVSFNQLAIDYEARGDLKQAEKLYRQAYVLFLKVGHVYNATVLASNVGGTLLSQGKLIEAEKMFQESLDLARKTGFKTAEDVPLENLAELAFLRGNVQLARERAETSIAQRRENNNPSSFVSILNELRGIMTAQADLTAARQNAAEALSIAQKTGARFVAAQSQLKLATLDLEESRAVQAEPVIRDALAVFRAEKMRDDELQALLVLARCLLMQNKPADAQAAIKEARQVSASTQNPANHLLFAIAEARVKAAQPAAQSPILPSRETRSDLLKCVNTARTLGLISLEYEGRLALSELEVKASAPAALERLAMLEKEAHTRGFDLIAGKATALRGTAARPN
jgi:tetratricopeptide (TPR) repeat protein